MPRTFAPGAEQFVPDGAGLEQLEHAARGCRGCDQYREATQTVFGEGDASGKRRIHHTPNRSEIIACRPWLAAELDVLDPDVLVCLKATAAKAVFGPSFRVTEQRGMPLPSPAEWSRTGLVVVATIHPSAVSRSRERDARYAGLADLQVVASELA